MTRDDLTDQTGSNCSTSVHVRIATISKPGFQVDAEKQSNGYDTLKHCITKECEGVCVRMQRAQRKRGTERCDLHGMMWDSTDEVATESAAALLF